MSFISKWLLPNHKNTHHSQVQIRVVNGAMSLDKVSFRRSPVVRSQYKAVNSLLNKGKAE